MLQSCRKWMDAPCGRLANSIWHSPGLNCMQVSVMSVTKDIRSENIPDQPGRNFGNGFHNKWVSRY